MKSVNMLVHVDLCWREESTSLRKWIKCVINGRTCSRRIIKMSDRNSVTAPFSLEPFLTNLFKHRNSPRYSKELNNVCSSWVDAGFNGRPNLPELILIVKNVPLMHWGASWETSGAAFILLILVRRCLTAQPAQQVWVLSGHLLLV